MISKQPFTKLCSDPAQALQMPPQTYLPTGMEGVITCPAASQPPLLRVDWTKDGKPLDLSMVLETLHSPFSACQQFGQNLFKCAQLEDKTITKWSKVTVDTLHLYFKQNYCFSLCLLLFQNNRIRSPSLFLTSRVFQYSTVFQLRKRGPENTAMFYLITSCYVDPGLLIAVKRLEESKNL